VKPQEAGRHALTIKYAGEHVPGSPFTLRVSGAPDASKVSNTQVLQFANKNSKRFSIQIFQVKI